MSYVNVRLTLDVSHQQRQEVGLGLVQGRRVLSACHVEFRMVSAGKTFVEN